MKSRRRWLLLALGLLLAAGSAIAAFFAVRTAKKAREPYWLEDPNERFDVSSLAFSPEDDWLAAGHADGSVSVWSLRERKLVHHEPGTGDANARPLGAVAFTADGRLAVAGVGSACTLRRLPEWESAGTLGAVGSESTTTAVATHGSLVARAVNWTQNWGARIEIWDVAGEPVLLTQFGTDRTRTLAFNPDGTGLFVHRADDNDSVFVHDTRTGARLGQIGTRGLRQIAVSPMDGTLASACDDLEVRLFALDGSAHGGLTLPAPPEVDVENSWFPTTGLAFSPDGRLLAATASGMNRTDGQPRQHWGRVLSWLVFLDPTGGRPAVIENPPAARAGDGRSMERLGALAFSSSGEWVAMGVGQDVHLVRVP